MDPDWQPCRLIALDGSSQGRQVGPQGPCTSAGWSPDGKWMYLGVEIGGSHHLWRQRFPSGDPEQITFGPTEEEGIAVAAGGRSLVTSVGMRQRAVWLRDDQGDRSLSSQGYVISSVVHGILPKFASNGKSVFYLNRLKAPLSGHELWKADIASGKSEPVLPGVSMAEYDISDNGEEVVYSTRPPGKPSQLWLAAFDRSSRPKLIASSGESLPHFSHDGQIAFQFPEGKGHYVGRMNKDGSGLSRVSVHPVDGIQSMSADRRWVAAVAPLPDGSVSATIAIPLAGGVPVRICTGYCPAGWSADGRFLYVGVQRPSHRNPGKTLAIPIPPGATLPRLPESGIRGLEDGQILPGARVIDAWEISPGPDPSVFAYVKTTVHRNLFRIPLR
jgi:Tol biopolymer transport system component